MREGLRGRLLATAVLAVTGCSSTPAIDLCVRTAPDDDPFARASNELILRATPREGVAIQQGFEPDTRTLELPPLDFGTWSFALEAYGPALMARGETPLVEITSEQARVPCLYFATIGTFGDVPVPPSFGAVRLAFSEPESNRALLATDDGFVTYDHETGTFAPGRPLPLSTAAGAVWTQLQRGRAAIITADEGAIVGPDGALEGEIVPLANVGPLDGAASSFVDLYRVLLVGGADGPDGKPPVECALRVVDLRGGGVSCLSSDLDTGTGTHLLRLRDTRVESLADGTFVIAGGNEGSATSAIASSVIAVIDPEVGIVSTTELDFPRRDPALAVTPDVVLVLGGRDSPGGPLDTIERFQIAGRQPSHLSTPTLPLTVPRYGALALVAGGGVLVVGGVTGSAEADATADRFSFERDGAVAANAPGVALPSPTAVDLHDGTFLVVSGGGEGVTSAAVVYRP